MLLSTWLTDLKCVDHNRCIIELEWNTFQIVLLSHSWCFCWIIQLATCWWDDESSSWEYYSKTSDIMRVIQNVNVDVHSIMYKWISKQTIISWNISFDASDTCTSYDMLLSFFLRLFNRAWCWWWWWWGWFNHVLHMIVFRSSSEWYDTSWIIIQHTASQERCDISYITQHHYSPHHCHPITVINIISIHHMHHVWQLIHPIPHNVLDSSLNEVEDRHHIIEGLPLCSINDFEIEIHVVSSSMIHHDTWYMYHEWWIVSIVCDIEWSMYRLIDRLNDRMIDWLFSLFNRSICFDKSHHSFIKLIHSSNHSFTWYQ